MGHDHDHGLGDIRHERPLWWAFGLTVGFLAAEVVGGLVTGSLALLSDAAHMGTDAFALLIALTAVRMTRRPADARRTYGYVRMEALGALANGVLLFAASLWILYEAWRRFLDPGEIGSVGMMVVAGLGLVVNLIGMRLLKAGSGENLNMRGAYLEVWADALGSVGVLVAAAVIMATGWVVLDPIVAAAIGLWVLPRTWVLVRDAVHVLLEGIPKGLDLDAVRRTLRETPGVAGVHDLHVWSLGSRTPALTAHVVMAEGVDDHDALRAELAHRLVHAFDIHHATLQMESAHCAPPPGHEHAHEPGHGHPPVVHE
ncbi:cation diffusion facilitator family transporter [Coralloluteibacterium stylophorae]|uniref:Cation transporter n=1 Tax=Coralloluteibacterium stylophorae TaxID=1776034 RepID=A0A8J7VST8_9GAMM|nr:cation diffusion facilitator family transporter [Coralloluteibacterium stylophorae]MBS7456191.1 cation transporter [Coralloluteibacterium stylophorae]